MKSWASYSNKVRGSTINWIIWINKVKDTQKEINDITPKSLRKNSMRTESADKTPIVKKGIDVR